MLKYNLPLLCISAPSPKKKKKKKSFSPIFRVGGGCEQGISRSCLNVPSKRPPLLQRIHNTCTNEWKGFIILVKYNVIKWVMGWYRLSLKVSPPLVHAKSVLETQLSFNTIWQLCCYIFFVGRVPRFLQCTDYAICHANANLKVRIVYRKCIIFIIGCFILYEKNCCWRNA